LLPKTPLDSSTSGGYRGAEHLFSVNRSLKFFNTFEPRLTLHMTQTNDQGKKKQTEKNVSVKHIVGRGKQPTRNVIWGLSVGEKTTLLIGWVLWDWLRVG